MTALEGDGVDPVSYTHLDVYKRQLQGGQIVELRRIDRLRFLPERRNDGLLFLASRRNLLCFLFGFDLFQIGSQITLADMDVEILLLLEGRCV